MQTNEWWHISSTYFPYSQSGQGCSSYMKVEEVKNGNGKWECGDDRLKTREPQSMQYKFSSRRDATRREGFGLIYVACGGKEYDVVVSCSNVICGIVRITRSHTHTHTHMRSHMAHTHRGNTKWVSDSPDNETWRQNVKWRCQQQRQMCVCVCVSVCIALYAVLKLLPGLCGCI